jgi:hypothetical protein
MTEQQMANRLLASRDGMLPIIDPDSGKLLGIVKKENAIRS